MGTGINMQASVHNLTQTERLQQDAHRLPVANQEQNAQKMLKDARHRLTVAPQSDTVEGKICDSQDRKKVFLKKKRKKKNTPQNNKNKNTSHRGEGLFIDCDA